MVSMMKTVLYGAAKHGILHLQLQLNVQSPLFAYLHYRVSAAVLLGPYKKSPVSGQNQCGDTLFFLFFSFFFFFFGQPVKYVSYIMYTWLLQPGQISQSMVANTNQVYTPK